MISTALPELRRILLVAEDEIVHQDFRTALHNSAPNTEYIEQAVASLLLDDTPSPESNTPVDYEVDSAYSGSDAIAMALAEKQKCNPYAVVFLNISMLGEWGGIATAKRLWHDSPDIHIALCIESLECSADEAVEQLGLTDKLIILKKPLDKAEVAITATTLAEKWQMTRNSHLLLQRQSEYIVDSSSVIGMIHEHQSQLNEAHDDLQVRAKELHTSLTEHLADLDATRDITVHALAELAESRCAETGAHLEHLRSYAQVIAEELSQHGPYCDQIDDRFLRDFYRATPMHDIGKVGIPDNILMKPGPLTTEEFDIMKQHTLIGARALTKAAGRSRAGSFLRMAATVALHHHERFNGAGYPEGLSGEDIPLCARIVAIVDVFDALVSERVYKSAFDTNRAYGIILSERDEHFDPFICDAFEACFDRIVETKKSIDQLFSSVDSESSIPIKSMVIEPELALSGV